MSAGSAVAAPGGIPGRPGGGGGPGEETEEAAHNLSYPVILPEGLAPGGLPLDNAWRFVVVGDPTTECFTGNTGGEPVPAEFDCYWDGTQVWWLSKRLDNFWKAFSLPVDPLQHP